MNHLDTAQMQDLFSAKAKRLLFLPGRVLDDRGASISAAIALSERDQMPYELAPKEGLALINGIGFPLTVPVCT